MGGPRSAKHDQQQTEASRQDALSAAATAHSAKLGEVTEQLEASERAVRRLEQQEREVHLPPPNKDACAHVLCQCPCISYGISVMAH